MVIAPASPIKHMIYFRIDNLTLVDSVAICGSGVAESCHCADVIQQRFRIRYFTIIAGQCFVCHLPVLQIYVKIKPALDFPENLLKGLLIKNKFPVTPSRLPSKICGFGISRGIKSCLPSALSLLPELYCV